MRAFRQGEREAGGALADAFYRELRGLAAAKMKGERAAHSWQPTDLVHELYLQLMKVRGLRPAGPEGDQAAFIGLAGFLMKRLLIHHARPLSQRIEKLELFEEACSDTHAQSRQDVEDALSRLAAIDPRLRTVVELKVFEGLTGEEIARRLGCSRGTVSNCWRFAQRWLQHEWIARPHE